MGQDKKLVVFLKGSAVLVLSNMTLKAINFFLLPLYTGYLSPADLGVSDTITTVTGFILPVLVMGLDSGFSAFFFDERTQEHQKKVFNTVLVTLIAASIIPIVLAIFAKTWSEMIFGTEQRWMIVAVSFVSVSFNLWYLPFSLLIRMKNKMRVFASINIAASLLMIGLNILFVTVLELGAFALVLSSAIIQLVQFVFYIICAKQRFEPKCFNKPLHNRLLKYSLPLVPMTVAMWVLTLSDRYILLMYSGESAVGIYGIGARFAMMLSALSAGVYTAYTTFAFDKKDDDNAGKQFSRVLNAYFVILIAICFTVSIWGKEVIGLMTSAEYYEAYEIIPCIMFGQLVYGINTIVGYGISFAKKTQYTLIAVSTGALLNVVLNIFFIPRYGVIAAAATTLAGYSIMTAMTYIFSNRLYPIDYDIKKIVILCSVLFTVSQIGMDFPIEIKAIIWIIAAISTAFIFKDAVKDILRILQSVINTIRSKG